MLLDSPLFPFTLFLRVNANNISGSTPPVQRLSQSDPIELCVRGVGDQERSFELKTFIPCEKTCLSGRRRSPCSPPEMEHANTTIDSDLTSLNLSSSEEDNSVENLRVCFVSLFLTPLYFTVMLPIPFFVIVFCSL